MPIPESVRLVCFDQRLWVREYMFVHGVHGYIYGCLHVSHVSMSRYLAVYLCISVYVCQSLFINKSMYLSLLY